MTPQLGTGIALTCRDVSYSWSDSPSAQILNNVTFDVRPGEFVSIIGPSGCGKSTLLAIIAGLSGPSSGEVEFSPSNGDVARPDLGIVFQEHGLFPWLNVEQNVEFGPRMRRIPTAQRTVASETVLKNVGLWDARSKYPHQLSGGMKHRAAIARVLANDSGCILMDEPFGGLDYQTGIRMQEFLLQIWESYRKMIVLVTHQVDEAIYLSDRILLMSAPPSRIAETITVTLERPRNRTDARFNDYRRIVAAHLDREVAKMFGSVT